MTDERKPSRHGTWESHNAITGLLYRYQDCMNRGRFDELGDLFTHGTYRSVYPWSDEGHGVQTSAQEVASLFHEMVQLHDGLPRIHFITTNAMIDIDEDAGTASSTSYYIGLFGDARSYSQYIGIESRDDEKNPIQIMSAGRYLDTFHRIDGEWWFKSRTCVADFTGDRSGHNKHDPVEYGKAFSEGNR